MASVLFYIKLHPVLLVGAISWNKYDDTIRWFEIGNEGVFSIKLKSVLVNGTKTPEKVELGISRSLHVVSGGGLDEDPDITFHNIDEYRIKPRLSPKKLGELAEIHDRAVIKNYGIRINHDEPLENAIIKYTYLGIPFTYKKDLRLNN